MSYSNRGSQGGPAEGWQKSLHLHRRFDKASYLEVRDKINELYFDNSEYYSSSMDILASFVVSLCYHHS